MKARTQLQLALTGFLLLCWTCGGDREEQAQAPVVESSSPYPPTAKVAVHEQFVEDLALQRAPSDGGGSVRLLLAEGDDGSVRAGGYARWEFVFSAGPLGIAKGGSLLLLVPPFWGWSTPQVQTPERPGYTTVATEAAGVELFPATVDRNLLMIEIGGRALAAGETLRIVYGASDALARADDYAEANSAFYFKVDGDGDGLSGLVDSRPAITVHPGPPVRMTATMASTAEPGAQVKLTLALLDGMANLAQAVEGTLTLESIPPGLDLAAELPWAGARETVTLAAAQRGTYRVRAVMRSGDFETAALSNPLRVAADIEPVYWGDLHGHSNYSDGTGTPEDYFAYARDVAALDFAVLTDHDHFGVRFLDATPEIWEEIEEQSQRFNAPGKFLSLLGYEWTSWLYGHRHVVYFNGQGEVLTSVGAATTTPQELWDALAGQPVLTFAHHSAGGPVATDWSFTPPPLMEPVTEIMSVHGSSEAYDSPSRIYSALPGNFVRDQLDRGTRFGFIGSGDSHDGHPGHAHLSPNAGFRLTRPDPRGKRSDHRMGKGGVAAVRSSGLTQAQLLAAFQSRSTYATSGPRIWLSTTLAGLPMGTTLPPSKTATMLVEFAGTDNVAHVEIIQRGRPIERVLFNGTLDAAFEHELTGLAAGDYVYVRLLQTDGALAWSSPFFVD